MVKSKRTICLPACGFCGNRKVVTLTCGTILCKNPQCMRVNPRKDSKCPHCKGLIKIRNPTGKCDHLYYPENVNKNYPEGKEESSELSRGAKK